MTDRAKEMVEIIRHCASGNDGSNCKTCSYAHTDTLDNACVNVLFRDSANLLESLAAENERLKAELMHMKGSLNAEEDRAIVLMKACLDLLNKQKESYFVLNLLEQIVVYDEADCDGYCLSDDIEDYLIEKGALSLDE